MRTAPAPGASRALRFLVLVAPLVLVATQASASAQGTAAEGELVYDEPFFPGAAYDPGIPTADAVLGRRHASRLSTCEEILACFERWVASSPRITMAPYGLSHEGRSLVRAVVTSPANHARLDGIRAALARLHDPRGLDDGEAERLVLETPAAAWMGYSIHGDETSGADAAVALAHHLVASTDPAVESLLDRLVVVIDPVMNPDGRERILGMVEQSLGRTPSLDWAGMQRGRWPYGRGNHYLFDLNRDWMAGTQPETRGRWRAILAFHPQLLVDGHEMGSLDTFLFYPQDRPINPHYPPRHLEWQETYAAAIARAFDRYGWGYYTREWADGWAPFYSDAWGSLVGATGLLYEQARTLGTPLRRASGRVLTYRESVHHQAVASLATLETLAARREEVLRDFLANQRRNVAEDVPENARVFVLVPGRHPQREAELVRLLLDQEVEVFRAAEAFAGVDAEGHLGEREASRELPAGSLLVPSRQPMGPLVRAYLGFDPRMDREALLREREDLERGRGSGIYDVTAWSLPHALDVEGWWIDEPDVARERVGAAPGRAGSVEEAGPEAPFAWISAGDDDASVAFAARAMELGLAVHFADEEFQVGGAAWPRGSVVVRRHENAGTAAEIAARVRRAAEKAGARVAVTTSGRSEGEGPDLGGGHFHLLARPRVALLSNAPIAPDRFGHLWHHLDREVGLPLALLDAAQLGGYDLRRYNVLVLPGPWEGLEAVLEPHVDALATWVEGGGTLVACGEAAVALTRERLGLSSVVLRRDVLDDLAPYRRQARRELAARTVEVDEGALWGEPPGGDAGSADEDGDGPGSAGKENAGGHGSEAVEDAGGRGGGSEVAEGAGGGDEPEVAENADAGRPADAGDAADEPEAIPADEDAWQRRFAPWGATLRGLADVESWITAGAGAELPVPVFGSHVLLTEEPARAPVRLAPAGRLRLAGLLWPEARDRLAESAWLTVERKGDGQIVLFSTSPAYRGHHAATARLFANAVVLGPGLGASQPVGW